MSKANLKKIKISLKLINKVLFTLILIFGIYCVISINDLSIKGFAIKDLKKQTQELEQKKQEIEIKIAYLKSYNALDAKIKDSNFVAIKDIEYIKIGNDQLSMARNQVFNN